jgi:hypothetical protein
MSQTNAIIFRIKADRAQTVERRSWRSANERSNDGHNARLSPSSMRLPPQPQSAPPRIRRPDEEDVAVRSHVGDRVLRLDSATSGCS